MIAKQMNINLKDVVINQNKSIHNALQNVDKNQLGFIITTNYNNEAVGLATDGDIRRALLRGHTLNDKIKNCHNVNFKFVYKTSSRENIIKLLDSNTHFVPVLDKNNKLVSIFTKENIPLNREEEIYIRSRSPVRISFSGGGSDVTHYFKHDIGAVINSAISLYTNAIMKIRFDKRILIISRDLQETFESSSLHEALSKKGNFGLFQALLHIVRPTYGFELYVNSDFPIKSGLGGSAAVCAAVLGCFNAIRKDKWTNHEMAEISFQAERLHLKIAGGWQDQYATIFGGFNFIEFNSSQNVINSMKIQPDYLLELEESLVLCDTGITHNSGNIHKDQKKNAELNKVKTMIKKNVELSYVIKEKILRGEFDEFGKLLNQTWIIKKQFSKLISNSKLDQIYENSLRNGAIGGKLLGAGGGGFFIFYVPPFQKHNLLDYLKKANLTIKPFRFEPDGLKTWTSRLK